MDPFTQKFALSLLIELLFNFLTELKHERLQIFCLSEFLRETLSMLRNEKLTYCQSEMKNLFDFFKGERTKRVNQPIISNRLKADGKINLRAFHKFSLMHAFRMIMRGSVAPVPTSVTVPKILVR